VTRIRLFYPQNYDRNGPQAFPQSNMVVLVDTEAGITGIGQGGSPDTVRNVARSVIGRNAFDTEMIWQAAFMDGFYSPGKERLHALGAIDLALWDIKGKALGVPLYHCFGGKAREHIELYATSGLPQGLVPQAEAAAMTLKERAARTMAAGYRVFRVDSDILPNPGGPAGARRGPAQGATFDSRSHIRLIAEAAAQMREGVGADGNWMIDLHQKFDFHEAVEVCRLMEPNRPFIVEDPAARGAVPHAVAKAAADDVRAAGAGGGVGHPSGLQPARREPRHRLRASIAAQRGRHHRDAEDHGGLRHAPRRHRPAFHRSHRHGGAHANHDGLSGAGADGIQPGASARYLTCRTSSSPATGRCGPTIALASASRWTSVSSPSLKPSRRERPARARSASTDR
jgi:hypothetical protein